ncbi:MAG: hypothetical protein OEZ23_03165, partial [Gammaproteobacteria bacterium]|nr:hypothetical protein [Gammaproteobacteria bacterium]
MAKKRLLYLLGPLFLSAVLVVLDTGVQFACAQTGALHGSDQHSDAEVRKRLDQLQSYSREYRRIDPPRSIAYAQE